MQLGCPNCMRVIRSPKPPPVRCRYCGYQIGPDDGERLGVYLHGLDATMLEQLLDGNAPADLVRAVREQGIVEEKAFGFVDQQVQELPFARHERWKTGLSPSPGPACDSCGVNAELHPWEAEWGLDPEAMKRYRPDFGGFTGEFGKPEHYAKWALYYLCDRCRKLNPNKFAGGYPARNGYVRTRFKRVKKV